MRRMLLGLAMLTAYAVLSTQYSVLGAADLATSGPSDYYLTKQHGPYLILVGSFVGDDAGEMAVKLTTELRKDYKLQAYIYSKSEQERAERDRLIEEWKRQNNGAPARKVRIVDEYTVLVGPYKSMDSASVDLKGRIKDLKPPKSVPAGPGLFIARQQYKPGVTNWLDGGKIEKGGLTSHFGRAFVVRNPLLPLDKTALHKSGELGDDESALLELNAAEPHTLMKCKKPWTLLVSVRGGAAITQASKPSVFDKVNPWSPTVGTPTRLSAKDAPNAAEEARKLTEVLRGREFGYEAYVLHSRGASFVTVGGFNAPNDPEMFSVQRQLARMSVGNIKLLDTPMPMPVPKP